MLMLAHGLLLATLSAHPPPASLDLRAVGAVSLQSSSSPVTPSKARVRVQKWAPWIGAAAGGILMGTAVKDEHDLVPTGKLMWIGIGAGGGAAVGWIVRKIAGG
jgi:hypothetical protein